MKNHRVLITAMMLGLAGCQGAPRPASGMASVRVKVLAEPKAGVKAPAEVLRVYDTPRSYGSAGGGGDYERVDYSALDEIVVWVEPEGPRANPMDGMLVG